MAKKRGGIADGIKAVYHVQQVYDAIESVSAPRVRRFLESVAEIVMIGASLAAVCGLFWLVSVALQYFKNHPL
jgi:hypothetical protein